MSVPPILDTGNHKDARTNRSLTLGITRKNITMIDLNTLNDKQREAVTYHEGPMLILAGAGSGKTRVLTHRIAYLIQHYQVRPYEILALTFTNKAAKEMRQRVDSMVGFGSDAIWVTTFHATCVRFLRRFIDEIGYDRSFAIYDTEDQRTLIREIMKQQNVDTSKIKDRAVAHAISNAKNQMIDSVQYEAEFGFSYPESEYASLYKAYQQRLFQNNALDFDDLLLKTIELFEKSPEVLDYYQNRFRYILVDEYQDTNTPQFRILQLLAAKYENLCVVGDDDQSIYKFRGANIRNILDFETNYPNAKVIRLEQNYRSTQNILEAANGVISNNVGRKSKKLWTAGDEGSPITYYPCMSDYEEASTVISHIEKNKKENQCRYSDFVILYRTNAQSRVLEEKLVSASIPYSIVGGTNFYSRKEIKDLLSYLRFLNNPADDLSIKRIINVPRRGIGATTLERITSYGMQEHISFFEAMERVEEIPSINRGTAAKIEKFLALYHSLQDARQNEEITLEVLFNRVLSETGYEQLLIMEDTIESTTRLENIDSLRTKIIQFEEEYQASEKESPTLGELLENIALVADIDQVDEDTDQVLLMTLHSAKGLEFDYVFMVGMEEDLFPSYMATQSLSDEEIEEERRLCYVGITRAKKELVLCSASQRMRNGNVMLQNPSRFIHEVPRHLLHVAGERKTPASLTPGHPSGRSTGFSGSSIGSFSRSTSFPGTTSGFSGSANRRKNHSFGDNPYIKKGLGNSSTTVDYKVGDTVYHIKFGTGTVTSLKKITGDYEVEVNFESYGVRKLRASFAKLCKM